MNKFSKVLAMTAMVGALTVSGGVFGESVDAKVMKKDAAGTPIYEVAESYLNLSKGMQLLAKDYSDVVQIVPVMNLDQHGYYFNIKMNTLLEGKKYTVESLQKKNDSVADLLLIVLENKETYQSLLNEKGLLTISVSYELDKEQKEYKHTKFAIGGKNILDMSNINQNDLITKYKTYPSVQTVGFADYKNVSTNWGYENVQSLVGKGIVNGSMQKGQLFYMPKDSITRGQFAAMLARTIPNATPVTNTMPFKDVSSNAYFAENIHLLYELGVVGGTTATTFEPNKKITRQQASAMVIRYLDAIGADTSNVSTTMTFTDTKNLKWGKEDIGKLYNLGVIQGKTPQSFDPAGPLTREQMAKILDESLKLKAE